jgi:hypothetical protein
VQRLGGPLAHAPQRVHRQRVQEVEDLAGRHHDHPVRLGAGGAELGHELARRHPDRAGQLLFLGDPAPDPGGDGGGPPEQTLRAGHVEERLVQ